MKYRKFLRWALDHGFGKMYDLQIFMNELIISTNESIIGTNESIIKLIEEGIYGQGES